MNWMFIVFVTHHSWVVYVAAQEAAWFLHVECDLYYIPMKDRERVKYIFSFGFRSRSGNYLLCES